MIKQVRIRNFQKHLELDLELGPGLNVLVGVTEAGKSAVLRAIRWVMFNEPAGEDFRHPRKTTSVTLVTGAGKEVTRLRGRKLNRYVVDGLELDNFGKGVPVEVSEALEVVGVRLPSQSTELNYKDQLEAPFLLTMTGGARSAVLDRLCGNDIASKVVRDLNAEVNRLGREGSELLQKNKVLREKFEALGPLDEEKEMLDLIEAGVGWTARLVLDVKRLDNLASTLGELDDDLVAARLSLSELPRSEDLPDLADLEKQVAAQGWLEEAAKEFKRLRVERAKALSARAGAFDLDGLQDILAVGPGLKMLGTLVLDLKEVRRDLTEARGDFNTGKEVLQAIGLEAEELLDKWDACPTCGTELDQAMREWMMP